MGQTPSGEGPNQGSGEGSGGPGGWQKLLMGGLKGGLTGFSNMQNQNQMLRQGGPPMQVPIPQQPQVQLPMGLSQPQRRGPNDLNFYGGGY